MGDTAEASKPNPPSRHVAHLESTKLMTRTAPLATKLALALFTAASLGGVWPALANKPALPSAAPASTAQAPGVDNLEIGVAALQRGHHATALRAWRAAADQGNVKAQTNIGYLHEHGLGVPQSYVEAMAWYRKAAAQNEPTAQFNIGTLYAYGYGVERNPREALVWFGLAARQSLPDAQYMLGQAYHEGVGTPANAALALDWFGKAARQGHSAGQMMSAQVYLSGDAGKADPYKAYVWSDVALRNGRTEAGLIRDYASYKLNQKNIELAKQEAQRCLQSAYRQCPAP